MTTDLRGDDPGRWGHSLANLIEILVPLLDAAGARSVAEVGSYAGDFTRDLLEWAASAGARVTAVDPSPQPELVELGEQHEELELISKPSLEALPEIALPDAVIIDGDHNYYTVSEELRLVDERAPEGELPLLIFHDVGWPHARRDAYYDPGRIPADYRESVVPGGGLFPGEPGLVPGALPYRFVAAREGGPRNGVLTAIEDFMQGRDGLRLAIVPAFFGLGVVWRERASWADRVAAVLEPWNHNSTLARLEANRVRHLATCYVQQCEVNELRERIKVYENVLRPMLNSKAFAWAERLSRLRQRGQPRLSREQVRQALGEPGAGE
jgi:hypothetical protein